MHKLLAVHRVSEDGGHGERVADERVVPGIDVLWQQRKFPVDVQPLEL